MRIRILPMAVATALLLGVTGCTAVESATQPPPPQVAPTPARKPPLVPAESRPVQPVAREELGATETAKKREKTPKFRPLPPRPAKPDRAKAPALVPSARRPPVRQVPALAPRPAPATKPTTSRPAAREAATEQPRKKNSYGMRDVCAASSGITDPSITSLCTSKFGRTG